jgi:hypothetical protein
MGAKSLRKKYLLFFAVYLFLSMVGVVFDYHDPAHRGACAIWLARGSLSSAVNQTNFVPQADMTAVCLGPAEETPQFRSAISFSSASYRGPPSREASLLVHL